MSILICFEPSDHAGHRTRGAARVLARRAARHGDRRAVARQVGPNLLHDLTTQVNSCPSSQPSNEALAALGLLTAAAAR
jgi:hypothetical protein